tara:strand:- start:94 stop:300 length:207 start_codon:yes stop_codon:yes gene_type:complete
MGLKTQKNDDNIDKFLANIADEQKRTDCMSMLELMKELTGEPAVMWGKAIVGFGRILALPVLCSMTCH